MKHNPTSESSLEFIALVTQLTRDSQVVETTADEYEFLLDVLPPRWMSGRYFAFAEGIAPFRLLWRHRGRYFSRQLTLEETQNFCRLSGASLIE